MNLAPAAVPAPPAPPAEHHGPLLVLDPNELAGPLGANSIEHKLALVLLHSLKNGLSFGFRFPAIGKS